MKLTTANSSLPKATRVIFVVSQENVYPNYWKGDSEGHAKAGRLGGLKQSWKTNPGNFKNDPKKARRAGRKSRKSRKH